MGTDRAIEIAATIAKPTFVGYLRVAGGRLRNGCCGFQPPEMCGAADNDGWGK